MLNICVSPSQITTTPKNIMPTAAKISGTKAVFALANRLTLFVRFPDPITLRHACLQAPVTRYITRFLSYRSGNMLFLATRSGPSLAGRAFGRLFHRGLEPPIHPQQPSVRPGAELIGDLRLGLVGAERRILAGTRRDVAGHVGSHGRGPELSVDSTRSASFRGHRQLVARDTGHRLRAAARGSDGGVREELAEGVKSFRNSSKTGRKIETRAASEFAAMCAELMHCQQITALIQSPRRARSRKDSGLPA